MRVHVGDGEQIADLLRYFEEESDCVAVQVGEAEIEVSLLGSFRDDRHADAVEALVAQFRRLRNGDS